MGAFMAVITRSEGGGRLHPIEEGGSYWWGRPLGLHGVGGGWRGDVQGGGDTRPAWLKEEEGTKGGPRRPKG
jgi:hypothetical protein